MATSPSDPTDEEMAAIVAAVEAAWPRPSEREGRQRVVPRWRFSGRWWVRPIAGRRDRP